MSKKDSIAMIVALSVIFFAAAIAGSLQRSGDEKNSPSPMANTPAVSRQDKDKYPPTANVIIESPRPGDKLASPLTVTGSARRWYFEGSFPVELRDGNGRVLAVVPAAAQGDWMSDDFVPFTATLVFDAPATPTGALILKKDNPSGLPEYDDQVTVPVAFARDLPVMLPKRPCMVTGCSGQVCSDEDVATTCEYTAAYSCYKSAVCERQADGRCGWTTSDLLRSCLENAKNSAVDMPR